jgi:hypothetical protein
MAKAPAESGPTANERLTAISAVLLIVLLALEGVTILGIRPLLSWHVFVGMLLIPPVTLKLASTGYRFWRYYTGRPDYVLRGPPHVLLRLLAHSSSSRRSPSSRLEWAYSRWARGTTR